MLIFVAFLMLIFFADIAGLFDIGGKQSLRMSFRPTVQISLCLEDGRFHQRISGLSYLTSCVGLLNFVISHKRTWLFRTR